MRTLKLPPFENVAANSTAIMPRIPMGETYHGILLKLGGTTFTKALISLIKVRLGGKTIWEVTGSQLDAMNQYLGMTADAAYLLLPFSEFNARTILGEQIGALDTSLGYSGFSIDVQIGAATAPTLEAWALTTPVKTVGNEAHRTLFKAMLPATHNKAAAGEFSLPIPLGSSAGALLKRVHYFHSNITKVNVKMNGADLQDEGENALVQFWQNNLTRVTQSGHLCFDPLVTDDQSVAIPTVNEGGKEHNFEFRTTLSAADTVNTVSEMYAALTSI